MKFRIQNSNEIPSHAMRARNDDDSLWSMAAAKRIVIFALEWCRRIIPINSKSSFRGCVAAEGNSNKIQNSESKTQMKFNTPTILNFFTP